MQDLKAVIFDVDSTLAETEHDGHRTAFNQAFRNAGLDWHWDEALYEQLLAIDDEQARIHYYLENFHLQCGFNRDVTDIVRQLHDDKKRIHTQLLSSGQV